MELSAPCAQFGLTDQLTWQHSHILWQLYLLFHRRIILNIKPGVASILKKCIWWQYYLIQCRKPQIHNSKIQKIKKKKPIFVEKSMFPNAKAEKVHQSFSDQRINKLLLWWIITNFPYKNVNLALASPLVLLGFQLKMPKRSISFSRKPHTSSQLKIRYKSLVKKNEKYFVLNQGLSFYTNSRKYMADHFVRYICLTTD